MPRKRTILTAAAATLAVVFLLPSLVNVNRFRSHIVGALAAGLGRPVQASHVRLKLFGGPGFDLENVSVADDPAFGIEPFARMPTLRATLRLRSLWTGRLSFSSLIFVRPSLNLARNADGRWNAEPLMSRAAVTSLHPDAPAYVELQDARINFKFGNTKSVFFLSGLDAALYSTPPPDGGSAPARWNLRFTCSPARTDRTLTDVGRLRVEGSFAPAPAGVPGAGSDLQLQVDLTDAYLADLLVLASGTDHGIHGVLDVQAGLRGHPEALQANGTLRLRDLHRWDMLPPERGSSVELRYEALLNGPAGRLEVEKLEASLGSGSLEGSGSVVRLLDHPEWKWHLRFSGAPAGNAVRAVQHFSPRLSRTLRLGGILDGELFLEGPPLQVQGFVIGRELEFEDRGLPQLRAAQTRLNLNGSTVSLAPTAVEVERGRNLNLEATWNWRTGKGEFSVAGRGLPLRAISPLLQAAGADLRPAPTSLPRPSLPQPSLPQHGYLALKLRGQIARDTAPSVSGWGQLARARWVPPGLSTPVLLHTARLDFGSDQVRVSRLVATWAGATITGSVRIPLRPSPVYWADLKVNEWDSAALAAILRPALRRARPALLAARRQAGAEAGSSPSAARTPAASPFRAQGRLRVGRLRLPRLEVKEIETAFRLTGRSLRLEQARAAFAGGTWTGSSRLDFQARGPRYQVNGLVQGVDLAALAALSPRLEGLAAGRASGSLRLLTSGWEASDLLNNLNIGVQLEGRDLDLRNVDLEAAATGQPSISKGISRLLFFSADLAVEQRQVRLRKLILEAPSVTFQASGTVGFDHVADILVLPLDSTSLSSFRLIGPLELPRLPGPEVARRAAGGK